MTETISVTTPAEPCRVTERECPECGEFLLSDPGHSIGAMHAICKKCDFCPDCDEGAV